jgi:nicotinamide-nucleotide amidase
VESINVNAEIITIGDEILIGQVIDTNSAWIAQQLNLIGINVGQISSISDNKQHIINSLDIASLRADLIIVTGGLGPTKDDITKQTIAEYFHGRLIRNEQVFEHIILWLEARNGKMNELNEKQAEVPETCEVIPNNHGTAPGMWFYKDNIVFVFLPGVPFEMKGIMNDSLLTRFKKEFETPAIYHKTLMLQGIAESSLALLIQTWETQLPANIKLAYLPSPGIIRLRLSGKGDTIKNLTEIIKGEIGKVMPLIYPYFYSEIDEPIEVTLGKVLIQNDKTISTAESCSGGKIASLITSVPGSSGYYKGSVVAYSNQIKSKILQVDERIISKHGAVSQQVVELMAANVRNLFETDFSVAISGIAGPDGGTEEKPVGTTWIAVASEKQVLSKKYIFADNRERNIQRASITALNDLRKLILQDQTEIEKK